MRTDSTTVGNFYEFFAGGGLARIGLGHGWRCLLANDIDPKKIAQYQRVFGDAEMIGGDVSLLAGRALPRGADLAWASFPCQDLSLAGARAGLSAPRSGAFWGFWRTIQSLGADAPSLIALENVTGLLTSHGGADFSALVGVLSEAGYKVGALTIDASSFLPQSRPRVFVIATRDAIPPALRSEVPESFHSAALVEAVNRLPEKSSKAWVWWRLPPAPLRNASLADLLDPDDLVSWRSEEETDRLLCLMTEKQRCQIETVRASGARRVGAAFRRIRLHDGAKTQRLEARFDGLAGCLRTPAGGSSRQIVLVVEKGGVRSRLLTPRECARLMGVGEDYSLPDSANAALHLMGDAVAVPVVRWLEEHLLGPLARAGRKTARAA